MNRDVILCRLRKTKGLISLCDMAAGVHLCFSHMLKASFLMMWLILFFQSSIASEKPGIFDCVMEGCSRLIGRGSYHLRVVSIWYLILPTVMFRMSQYFIQTVSHFTVTTIIKREKQENSVSTVLHTDRVTFHSHNHYKERGTRELFKYSTSYRPCHISLSQPL